MEKLETLIDHLKTDKESRQTLSDIRALVRNGEAEKFKEAFAKDSDARKNLVEKTGATDAKERKSAILLAGELGLLTDDGLRLRLLEQYSGEQTLFLREAYLKAVAASGGEEILTDTEKTLLRDRLSEIDSQDFPETDMKHILAERKGLEALLESDHERTKRALFKEPSGLPVLLVPVKGFYQVLKDRLSERGISRGISSIGALVMPPELQKVKDIRVYDYLMYMIRGDFSLEPGRIGDELKNSSLASFFDKTYNDKVSVRIYIHEKGEHSLKTAKRTSGELMRLFPQSLMNRSPYDGQLHFFRKKSGGYTLFYRPLTTDRRFDYDRKRLSTSMQPVMAAIMTALIDRYIGSYARVCDLFSGNGTLLLERDEALKTKVMFGVDTNEEAVEAGRFNASAKGREINFVHRSAFTFESDEPFDEIISDLPDLYEKTAGERSEFFEKLGVSTKRLLTDHGMAFYLTDQEFGIKAMVRKTKGLVFEEQIPFDDKRNIFVIKLEKQCQKNN